MVTGDNVNTEVVITKDCSILPSDSKYANSNFSWFKKIVSNMFNENYKR